MKNKHTTLLALVAFTGLLQQAKSQSTVDLGSSSSFAVLAGSGITITGSVDSSTITGDIGTFPTPTITGLGNLVLNGTNHAGDTTTEAAKIALGTAYGDAAGRAATTVVAELGGTVKTPGVYTSGTFGITGTLTLDSGGDSSAVFIFKTGTAGTTLITADFSHVVLTGGAQADHVFWQVGSSATLGGSSAFVGNILAQTSITVGAGATVNGRLLAQDGVVTLNGNNTVGGAPIITNNTLVVAGTVGTPLSFTITASGSPTSYAASPLPAGLVVNTATGAITGTPTTVGTTPVLLSATNASGTVNAALTITVAPAGVAPIITNNPLTAAGTVGTLFSFAITATGVPTSYAASGLPAGLVINTTTGAITGTPTTTGTTPVLLSATNAVGTGNAALTITVAPAGVAPIITNNPLTAAGTIGTPFSFVITATGSPTSYAASPLPAGFVLNPSTGAITGMPTTVGTTAVLLSATNAVGTGNAALTITVAPAGVAPIITNNPLTAAGTVGSLFSFTITATGVPTSYAASGLPAGLAISPTTGAITGTPTTAGTTSVLLSATNTVGTGNAALTITVAPAGVTPIITNSPLTAAGTVGTPFGFTITATGAPTSYAASGLPAGLAINTTTGVITGTPTTVGTTPVLLSATNAVGTGNAALTLTVAPAGVAPIITNNPLTAAGTVGAPFGFAVTATGEPTSYAASGLPTGLILNTTTGAITGTPTTVGTTSVLLSATNAVGTGDGALTITVAPAGVAPIITNDSLTAAGTVGTLFSFAITATGGPTSYSASGLPAGLAINTTTGAITGTPTTAGTTPVLLSATNAVGTGHAALTITVAPAGVAPIITNNPLTAAGTADTPFGFVITATGSPMSYSASPLPPGLVLNSATGAITGTPTTVGTTAVLLSATNAVGTGNAALTITVAPAGVTPIIINNPLTAAGSAGTPFGFAITATGLPTSYAASGLPGGMAINSTTGAITGTPTTAGTTSVLLSATNAVGTGNAALTITVAPAGVAPIITNNPLTAAGTVGAAFGFTITATGVPTSYAASGLPTGLVINTTTGAITGTPTTVGTTSVLLSATNAVGTGDAALSITVAPAGVAPIITNNPLSAAGTAGTPFGFAITATGEPTSYAASGLPIGLILNPTTGAITGTPTTVGTTSVLLSATNAVGAGNAALTITVAPAGVAPIITNNPLTAAGTAGTPFGFAVTATGGPMSYAASGLPAGLVINPTTGAITGTPTAVGTTPVLLSATNAVGTGNAALTITVASAGVAPIITNNPLTASGTVGTLFTFAITATGVPTSYAASDLPAGLAINTTTGAITGTPTTVGATPVLISATNAVGTGNAALTITVAPPGVAPIVTNNQLTAAGTVGTLFSFTIAATGLPTSYAASPLPPGLVVNAVTGAIAGTPTTVGTTPVLISATNAVGTGNAALTITVAPAGVAPIITNNPLTAAGTKGTPFGFTITATGSPTSYDASPLPAGLVVNATTGAITGTPTSVGNTAVLVSATNAAGTGNVTLTITVADIPPIITNNPLTAAGTVGTPFSFAITASSSPTSYAASPLPAGLALNPTTGAITGTPTTVGTTPVLLGATNVSGTGNAALTITVAPAGVAPIITNSPLTAAGTVGTLFNFAITATGVPTGYTASALPAGLAINSATGAITGTPTTVGTTAVLLSARNAAGTGNAALTITVAPAGVAPIITNNPLTAAGTVGTLFGFAMTASGSPTSYAAGPLPTGLALDARSGVITGTPTAAGTTAVLLSATNAVGTGHAALTITVAPAGVAPIITNSPLTAAGTAGTPFGFLITATGSPTSYAASPLPAGLVVNATTGAITGTPTTVGTTPVLLSATNAVGTGNAALTITVAPAGVAPIITNNPLTAAGTVGTLFGFTITATGAPTSYTASSLPTGLAINRATGAITGTPTTAGTTPVLLTASNAGGAGYAALTITVAPAGVAPIITSNPLTAGGTVGTPFGFAITATGSPTSYAASSLPVGLAINPATGAITGTPTTAGTMPVLLSATNAVGTGSAALTITVAPAGVSPIITNNPLTAAGTVGTPFGFAITATGSPTSYAASGLPAGLAINATTGVITGTPTAVGSATVLLRAANSTGTGSAALTITVAPAGVSPIITNSPLTASGTVGTPFGFAITATGSPTSYAASPLPAGLMVNATTGAITGTPTTAGTTSVLLSATNAVGTSTAVLTVSIAPPASSRLVNFSARALSGPGDQTLIIGFVVTGNGKNLLIRGIGPTLRTFNVVNFLADPVLTLYNADGSVATNDDWQINSSGRDQSILMAATASQVGAFALPNGSKDSALLLTVTNGSHTTGLLRPNSTPGVALIELYDTDVTSGARLINLSARMNVTAGEGTLIAGFVIAGNAPETLLIRGVGPTLAALGVTGVLADPQIAVFSGRSQITGNDNWGSGPGTAAQISSASAQVGAFALQNGSKDAALLITLQPGVYTVQVSGIADTTGVALIEIYEVQ